MNTNTHTRAHTSEVSHAMLLFNYGQSLRQFRLLLLSHAASHKTSDIQRALFVRLSSIFQWPSYSVDATALKVLCTIANGHLYVQMLFLLSLKFHVNVSHKQPFTSKSMSKQFSQLCISLINYLKRRKSHILRPSIRQKTLFRRKYLTKGKWSTVMS